MDTLFTLFLIVVGLVGLDLAALTWGVDSREPMSDDHIR